MTDAPTNPPETQAARFWPLLAGALCVALNVAASALAARHAGLWFDEAVQLLGLSLGPVEQVRWLTGVSPHDVGIGADRMPPLSYWTGWAWAQVFGAGEVPQRWLGIVATGAATLVVYLAARRAWGTAAGLAAGLVFGLSPNVVTFAPVIRAYPLFLLLSAATFACLARYLEAPAAGRRWLVALTACGLAATYTHFYGLVLSGACLTGALWGAWRARSSVVPVIVAGVFVLVGATGLAPFVSASTKVSEVWADEPGGLPKALARLAYRLVAHVAVLAAGTPAVALAGLGLAVTAASAASGLRRGPAAVAGGLLVALAAGGAAVAAAGLVVTTFKPASPSYNLWMLPGLALLAATATAGPWRKAGAVGVGLLAVAYFWADAQLALRGEYFSGPGQNLAGLVRRHRRDGLAVVHDEDRATAWFVYAPIRWQQGPGLKQYVLNGEGGQVRFDELPEGAQGLDPTSLRVERVLVVRAGAHGSDETLRALKEGPRPLGDGPTARALKADPGWVLETEATLPGGLLNADVDVFRRAPTPVPDGPLTRRP